MANFDYSESNGGPGDMLRAARESEGISLRGMADRLNWSTAHVEAIEENRFEIFRSSLYIRGYVRAYARMINLPEEEVLAVLDATRLPQDPVAPSESAPPQLVALPREKPLSGLIAGGTLALVLALAVYMALRAGPSEEDENSELPEAVGAEPVPGAADEQSQTEDGTAPPAAALETAPESPETNAAPETNPEAAAPAAPRPASQAAAAPAGEVPPSALSFNFSGDSWLEIHDASGALIHKDQHQAGDALSLQGAAPFTVIAGDVEAVELRYEGEPFDIPHQPGSVLVRFSVGSGSEAGP